MDVVNQGDDDASADEAGGAGSVGLDLDLSPRPGRQARGGRPRQARWPWLVVVAVLVGAIGFVISHALTDATQYYLTANEAVARRVEMGTRTFRLEGAVVDGSPRRTAQGVDFSVTANGATIAVHHQGDPPQLFQPCIPVVVEGHWAPGGEAFESNLMIIAHDQKYEEQNSARLQQARAQGDTATGACAVEKQPAP
jgi:cytochrome c-type biogenesis protein CcmE